MTLRSKLFGAILATLVPVLAVVVLVNLLQGKQRIADVEAWHRAALEFAAELAAQVPPEGLQDTVLLHGKQLDPRLVALAVFEKSEQGGLEPVLRSGAVTGDPEALEVARLLSEIADAENSAVLGEDGDMAVPVVRSAGLDPPRVEVIYVRLRPSQLDPVGTSRVMYLVIVGAGLVLMLVTWFIVGRVVSRPLRQVVHGAQRVAEGDHSLPVPASGSDDEIQQVVTSFNTMMIELGRLHELMRDQIGEAVGDARRTQESLVIAQRLAATGRVAAGIAHEVNNPLGGLINAVRALRTKDLSPAKRSEYLDLVEQGLHRIEVTVAKVLQFRPHKVDPQAVDLADVIRPVLALVRHRIETVRVEVVVAHAASPAVVFGDPYQLQQALLNVVLNALDAVEEAAPDEPHLLVQVSVDEDEVRLLVRDNGTGMSEEDMARAFDLFFTTKEVGKGSGLGLATAHKILEDHGGSVDLRNGDEGGLDVTFTLPRFRG